MMAPTAMNVLEALRVLAAARTRGQVVVTHQGSAREWPKLSRHELDFHYIPSAMGAAVSLGHGLALAQRDRQIWVITGDGSLIMNLGCLVTVAAHPAPNLSVIVLDNGVYEVTGGQKTAASLARSDLCQIARAAGIARSWSFARLDDWSHEAAGILEGPGPRFIALEVAPVTEHYLLDPPCPITDQVRRLRGHLTAR